ncbi:MAG TPA: hypothetical protein DHW65_01520 [Dehalococcoidia bacterium]|nr:hypothetical protein [Chloroflexota bacterium]MQF96423.1 DUF1800 domain-containing protein [SAR202 cluster bacterium]HAA95966.1 hypothetical protein [Dehalococcoidia bacterium]HCL25012.1 hypothetical protein [Dehalococcoidia bacterium]|tara:strand:- start:24103 stop:25512 length:1410 start_codon:yes stop_codon:yes gene_type:complete
MADADKDIALMAHLMRRAGFGARYDELETRAAKGYEATVEELLNPQDHPDGMDLDLAERSFIDWNHHVRGVPEYHAWRMINSARQLEEKMILFWHGILCIADSKLQSYPTEHNELEMFRRCGMGSFRELLVEISKDPAMVYFLDNCLSHKGNINENYGRELLELFSMGVGMDGKFNYTEDDVKECSRAFTGWTIANSVPGQPYGRYAANFLYNPDDHDEGEKTFLGETGNFNGEDVIDIICKRPATARFVSRHLYNFFVADDVEVPAWMDTPPQDMETIKMLEEEYFRSGYDIRSMLRLLFNSDAFKNARFSKIKSPIETIIGTLRLIGTWNTPKPGLEFIFDEMKYMGQEILNPPSVEGWHTGKEWIDGGTLAHRINFIAESVSETDSPGIRDIVQKVAVQGETISPKDLVAECLRYLGEYQVSEETQQMLVAHAEKGREIRTGSEDFPTTVADTLQMIVATKEYLYA